MKIDSATDDAIWYATLGKVWRASRECQSAKAFEDARSATWAATRNEHNHKVEPTHTAVCDATHAILGCRL